MEHSGAFMLAYFYCKFGRFIFLIVRDKVYAQAYWAYRSYTGAYGLRLDTYKCMTCYPFQDFKDGLSLKIKNRNKHLS